MAYYIKANPKVTKYLGVENDRTKSADGNYLLWQADMQRFGRLTELPKTMKKIGGILLRPIEAREEQDGITSRPLPIAEDERFREDYSESDNEQATEAEDDNNLNEEQQ